MNTPTPIDELEATLAACPPADCPVIHRFVPGMYIRETRIPAGTMGTSMEHLTEHPFVILRGRVRVVSENEGPVIYEAGQIGITKPHTRRVLFAEEDTVWVTFHATTETDVEKIADKILAPHANPLLPEGRGNEWRSHLPAPHAEHLTA